MGLNLLLLFLRFFSSDCYSLRMVVCTY
jgi:hypothetical protein